ncbi:uncharacterized protein LOC144359839 [Saccoglossus kowalevskii]
MGEPADKPDSTQAECSYPQRHQLHMEKVYNPLSNHSDSLIEIVDDVTSDDDELSINVDDIDEDDNISKDCTDLQTYASDDDIKVHATEHIQLSSVNKDMKDGQLHDHRDLLSTFNDALGSIINERLDVTRIGNAEKYSDNETELVHDKRKEFDDFDEWANGNVKRNYRPTDPEAQGHVSGWAMKYTNNHNKYVLKKACIGVIVCSKCSADPNITEDRRECDLTPIAIRPAISDKVREKQIGKPCSNPNCKGVMIHNKCRGNNGFPVVHLWSDQSDVIAFESRGIHDHPRPDTRRIPNEMLELGIDPAMVFEAELRLAQTKVTRPRQRREPQERIKGNESTVKNILTMDAIGCLPDNVQQAIKSFSIKPEKQHITLAFPFMVDVLKQMQIREGLPRAYHVTPVLLCDDNLELIEGFHTIITMAPNFQRSCMSIVQLTLWQQGTTEGLRRHFASLIKMLFDPTAHFACCHLPTLVADLKPTDRDQVIQACAETILDLQRDHLTKTFADRNVADIIQMLKDTMILPSLKSFHEYFYIALNEVGSKLPEQDSARFIALLDHMTSTKCSAYDFKRADIILRDPSLGPPIINEFWMYWGNELASCKVFPVAMAIFDAYKMNSEMTDDGGVAKATLAGFRLSFRRLPLKEGLNNIIQCLKSQNPECIDGSDKDSANRCGCDVCRTEPAARNDIKQTTEGPAIEFLKSLKTATEQGFTKFGLGEDALMRSAFHRPTHSTSPTSTSAQCLNKPETSLTNRFSFPHLLPQFQHHRRKSCPAFLLPGAAQPMSSPRLPLQSKDAVLSVQQHMPHRPSNVPMSSSFPYSVTPILPSLITYNPVLHNTLLATLYSNHHRNDNQIGPIRRTSNNLNYLKLFHPYKV